MFYDDMRWSMMRKRACAGTRNRSARGEGSSTGPQGGGCAAPRCRPVSYTHLDVYKRQERQLREGEFAARVSADHFVILLREPDGASTKERLNEFRLTSESVGEQVLVSMDFGAYILLSLIHI